jgi:diguanylate cyclase (GGDEF)-like protein
MSSPVVTTSAGIRDRLHHALERGYREHTPTCLLVVDLDGFKAINANYSHPVGDRALTVFAQRLQAGPRASATATRLGDAEFGILCENTDRPEAEILAARLAAAVREPLTLDGTKLGSSIGQRRALRHRPEDAYGRVVREADDVMYAVKRRRAEPPVAPMLPSSRCRRCGFAGR